MRVDLWSLRYISDDLMDGLPTLVLSCIFFVGLLLVNREVMFSYGVDGMRPNYEELVMDRFFHRDGEEEVRCPFYVHIMLKTIMLTG